MQINIANITDTDIKFLVECLGARTTNGRNIRNTQLVIERDGKFSHVGNINECIMQIDVDKLKK